ncbi:MAG: hypothetical protein IKY19_03980 [Bacteroidaceae bacterium]|nr:hypothetical protein [Bacteroidaceae bacterium]
MSTTTVLAAMAAYILVVVMLAVIDYKLTKIIERMGGGDNTQRPMKNNTYKIEYR